MYIMICQLLSLIPFVVASAEVNLVTCPDCGNEVSRRAVMCPKCGCAGDVIRKESAAVVESAVTGSVLKVDFGNWVGVALPVEMNGRHYAVMPLDDVLGMERLILSDEAQEVRWTVPEVAVAAPVVRLQIEDTNLVYWTVSGNFCFDAKRKTRQAGSCIAAISSELPSGRTDYRLDACTWQVLQPREMNRHGKLLLRLRGGEPCELPFRTHPYYKYLEKQWRKEVKE